MSKSLQSVYVFVHKDNPDLIWHINSYKKQMINTIPVFRTVHSAQVFKKEIMERNHFSKKWCLSKDKTTTENISKAIFHTKFEKFYEDESIETEIKPYNFAQTLIVSELIKYNIALLFIDSYWLKQSQSQIVVAGKLWYP